MQTRGAPSAELRAFHATARMGSMSAAARYLKLSQPTVSAHVASLERRYEVELFLRRGRTLELTEFGRSLLDVVSRQVEAEGEALTLLNAARGEVEGQLRVAAVGPYNLVCILKVFRARFPGIRLAADFGDSRDVVERVLAYKADVGILVHAVGNARLHEVPFRRQPLQLLVPRGHRLAERSSASLQDVEGEQFIAREPGSTTWRVFRDALLREGVRIRVAMELGSREAIRAAVAEGLGLGVVSTPAFVPAPGIAGVALRGVDLHTHAHVICLRDRAKSRLVHRFFEAVEVARGALPLEITPVGSRCP